MRFIRHFIIVFLLLIPFASANSENEQNFSVITPVPITTTSYSHELPPGASDIMKSSPPVSMNKPSNESIEQNVVKNSEPLNFSRNFWYPTYNTQRLSYCMFGGKACGRAVADRYCKIMGYKNAIKQIIDYNVGLTNYLLSRAHCKGWSCNGFMLITCAASFQHSPPKNYYYRSQRFVYPRFSHYRVDWCYENGKGCGHRAAYSFCRRMGYMRDQHYQKEENLGATKAIGNRRLCFGQTCAGFSSITCYR